MQIVEHDQHRMRPGTPFQKGGNRIEEAKPRLVWIELLANRGPVGRLPLSQIRNDLRHLLENASGDFGLHREIATAFGIKCIEEGSNHLNPGPVSRCAITLPASAP